MRVNTTYFNLGSEPVIGTGIGLDDSCLAETVDGGVIPAVCDDYGRERIESLLAGMADTQFSRANLDALLADRRDIECWRAGEALAETYLTENRDCFFPWPDSRDERKRGSCLPGADLVGFQRNGAAERFAFGEVKTSSEEKYPPNAMYGTHGLKQQLEDLRDNESIRMDLVRYLGHRASGMDWEGRYQEAGRTYLQDTSNVRVFGVMVRDVPPNEDDLRVRVTSLRGNCPASMRIELTAIYLPAGSIETLPDRISEARSRGGTS